FFFMKTDKVKYLTKEATTQWSGHVLISPYSLETLTTFQKYKQAQPSEQERMRDELNETMNKMSLRTKEKTSKDDKKGYNVYSADQKVLFLYYLQVRLYKAAKAARLSGVTERTGQQWAKRLKDDPA
ncbi:MAG: hypothetical protein EXX96DRAFT_480208, partial [Benjaminiella poitrasii]